MNECVIECFKKEQHKFIFLCYKSNITKHLLFIKLIDWPKLHDILRQLYHNQMMLI